jgi:hypothetical protein
MITDDQFKEAIGKISDHYEKLKDLCRDKIGVFEADDIIGELAAFRDTACTALRESHVNKNFNQN